MATHARRLIQDENLIVHYRGASFGGDSNASKAKKAKVLNGSKPLTNITNSRNPSPHKVELKKNHPKKLNAHNEGVSNGQKIDVSKIQKKAVGLGGRKALTNITNSTKSPHRASKKDHSTKLHDFKEEQFLHNHQECIDSQTRGMDMQLLLKTLGIDTDFSTQLATPVVIPVSKPAEDYFGSPPRYLEYEEVPELLLNEDQSPPRHWTSEHTITSPSPNRYPSLNVALLSTP